MGGRSPPSSESSRGPPFTRERIRMVLSQHLSGRRTRACDIAHDNREGPAGKVRFTVSTKQVQEVVTSAMETVKKPRNK